MSWNPNQGQDPNQPVQPEGYPQQPGQQPGSEPQQGPYQGGYQQPGYQPSGYPQPDYQQGGTTTARLSTRWLSATRLSTRRLPATNAIWLSLYFHQSEWSHIHGHGCQCCSGIELPVFNCRRANFLLRREAESLCAFSCNAVNSLQCVLDRFVYSVLFCPVSSLCHRYSKSISACFNMSYLPAAICNTCVVDYIDGLRVSG